MRTALVAARKGASEFSVQTLFKKHNVQQNEVVPQIELKIIKVPERALARTERVLSRHPKIKFVEKDFLFSPELLTNDPYLGSSWHLGKINAYDAWNLTTGRSQIIIAILDSGVDPSHPDLAANLVSGYNFYDNNTDTTDVYGHGTGVAGAAAAMGNNGIGVAGVAFGSKIMPIRTTNATGYATSSNMAKGLIYAADHGARVANLSFSVSNVTAIDTAAKYFQEKGGVITVSAGNYSTGSTRPDDPYVLTISATDANDSLCPWSNFGSSLDLAAPGTSIVTTMRGGNYGSGTGTSFSAPIVAGIAALIMSANSSLSGSQVETILKGSAEDLGQKGFDSSFGWGRVNANNAVSKALNTNPDVATPTPTASPTPTATPTATATNIPIVDTTNPSVEITSPMSGSRLLSATKVYVRAVDNVKIGKVELYIDGKLFGSSTSSMPVFSWNTKKTTKGLHTLLAYAFDAAGNKGVSASVTVTK